MNEKVLQLPVLMAELSNKMEQLESKVKKIGRQIIKQDDKIEKLWMGYNA